MPGVGTLPPQQWAGDRGGNWLRDQQLVYSFDYDPLSDGILVWQRVFDAGNALLDGIRSLTEVAEVRLSTFHLETFQLDVHAHDLHAVRWKSNRTGSAQSRGYHLEACKCSATVAYVGAADDP